MASETEDMETAEADAVSEEQGSDDKVSLEGTGGSNPAKNSEITTGDDNVNDVDDAPDDKTADTSPEGVDATIDENKEEINEAVRDDTSQAADENQGNSVENTAENTGDVSESGQNAFDRTGDISESVENTAENTGGIDESVENTVDRISDPDESVGNTGDRTSDGISGVDVDNEGEENPTSQEMEVGEEVDDSSEVLPEPVDHAEGQDEQHSLEDATSDEVSAQQSISQEEQEDNTVTETDQGKNAKDAVNITIEPFAAINSPEEEQSDDIPNESKSVIDETGEDAEQDEQPDDNSEGIADNTLEDVEQAEQPDEMDDIPNDPEGVTDSTVEDVELSEQPEVMDDVPDESEGVTDNTVEDVELTEEPEVIDDEPDETEGVTDNTVEAVELEEEPEVIDDVPDETEGVTDITVEDEELEEQPEEMDDVTNELEGVTDNTVEDVELEEQQDDTDNVPIEAESVNDKTEELVEEQEETGNVQDEPVTGTDSMQEDEVMEEQPDDTEPDPEPILIEDNGGLLETNNDVDTAEEQDMVEESADQNEPEKNEEEAVYEVQDSTADIDPDASGNDVQVQAEDIQDADESNEDSENVLVNESTQEEISDTNDADNDESENKKEFNDENDTNVEMMETAETDDDVVENVEMHENESVDDLNKDNFEETSNTEDSVNEVLGDDTSITEEANILQATNEVMQSDEGETSQTNIKDGELSGDTNISETTENSKEEKTSDTCNAENVQTSPEQEKLDIIPEVVSSSGDHIESDSKPGVITLDDNEDSDKVSPDLATDKEALDANIDESSQRVQSEEAGDDAAMAEMDASEIIENELSDVKPEDAADVKVKERSDDIEEIPLDKTSLQSGSEVKSDVDGDGTPDKPGVSNTDGEPMDVDGPEPATDDQKQNKPKVNKDDDDVMEVTGETTTDNKEPANEGKNSEESNGADQSFGLMEDGIKKEGEEEMSELKIVGVTSAVSKNDSENDEGNVLGLKIDSVSGGLKIDSVSGGLKIDSVSGGLKIDSVSGGLKIDSVSGADDLKSTKQVEVKKSEVSKPESIKEEKKKTEASSKKKGENDDVIAVKDEKKPPPPKPKSSKIQKCIVCSKVGKCKYNIVRNGDVKHLCDDTCFRQFRGNPTSYLKQAENEKNEKTKPVTEAVPVKNGTQSPATTPAAAKLKSLINTAQQSKAAGQGGENYKTCTVCQLMNVRTSKPFLNWQGLDYCGEECLGKFQANLSITCSYCSSQIHQSNKAKFCARIGDEVKHFCSQTCNTEYVKRIKVCAFCNKDLLHRSDSFMAPVGNQGMFKDFCSQECLLKYEDKNGKDLEVTGELVQGSKTAVAPTGNFNCAVCSKLGPVKHELKLENKLHRLCSDPCFSAFQYANKLTLNACDSCGTHCSNENGAPHYVQFEGKQKRFCSFMCVNAFRNKKKKPTPCAWCGTKKSNFDMIERVDSTNRFQLFCSLNCLSLYRVNLQATSNQAVLCDQCRKFVPAQYHLTMSDASVRNFCSYGCVMSFQSQFTNPQNQKQPSVANQKQITTQTTQPTNQQVTTTRSGRVVSRGPKQQIVAQQQPRKEIASKASKVNQESIPIISNVVSLAPQGNQQQINIKSTANVTVTDQQSGKSITTASAGNQTVQQQIIIQPPPPKTVKNKSTLCKPFVQTKATACRPHTQTKDVQTEGKPEPEKIFVPVPVPIYCPTPLAMHCVPVPILIPVPVPIPVPVFIPTTKKNSASILKQIKEIQEKIPADPLEAELLMMAEAVAGKGEESSSDSDEGETEAPATKEGTTGGNSGSALGEDMLQMALRMASEMSDEPVMDLENSLEPVAVNTEPPKSAQSTPVAKETQPDEEDDEYVPTTRSSKRGRGGTKRQTKATPRRNPKRLRTDVPSSQTQFEEPSSPSPTQPQAPPPDSNFHLKYTYGVNAFKHWVTQKNGQIEQANKPGNTRGGPKTLKTELLQCTADELNYALCLFVKEVRKPNGEEYAVDSIFYLCLGIQQFLFENGRIDNVFTDMYYERFTECLNELLTRYEPKLNHAGQLVCRIEEEHLWESKQLGAHSPHVLLNTLVYFNTKYFMLKTSEDHLKLSFTHIMKHWKKTASGRGSGTGPNLGRSVYLRYYCPTPQAKESSQKKKKEEMPVYEQTENLDNPLRCPVKLYEFYLSKCPESIKNRNDTFYLVPERSCVPDSPVWYSTAMLGVDAMAKMLNRIRLVREIQEAHLHTQPIYI